jgi:hypothetical protein
MDSTYCCCQFISTLLTKNIQQKFIKQN